MHVSESERRKVYASIPSFFPDLYEEEYALLDIYLMHPSQCERIREAAEKAGKIFWKTMHLLRLADDAVLTEDLGIPAAALPVLRLKTISAESVISRVDLVETEEGYKVLEINADTPTFIVENYHANAYICRHFQKENPNEGYGRMLTNAIRKAVYESSRYVNNPNPHIVFTSHQEHEEDRLTAQYLMDISRIDNAIYEGLERLQIDEDGLYDGEGRRIDILYRQTYPIEYLVEDEDPNSKQPIGTMLLELVRRKKLAIINPPSAFLMQSKAIQAVIWGLYEQNNPFFTEEEKAWIGLFFLPTYLDEDAFVGDHGTKYVKKPSFGREGNTVEIIDAMGKTVMEEHTKLYQESLPVYQKYVTLPEITIQTEKGPKLAHMLIGCFLIDGEPGAIGIRAGGQITDNASYYLPVGIKN